MNRPRLWIAALLIVGFLAMLGMFLFLPQILDPPLTAADLQDVTDAETRLQLRQAQADLENKVRSSLLQAIAGVLVTAGAVATWQQVQTSREGQITERFSRAVDQIGSVNLDVRIGGIYALRRIALNSRTDRNTVQYMLAAFVRNHALWAVGSPDGPQHPTPSVDEHLPWLQVRAPDIQAAISVLSRRPDPDRTRPLYLSRVDLRSAQLDRACLTGTWIRHANLARAWLRGTKLDCSDLKNTDLRRAHLAEASLVKANLAGAYLEGAELARADLRGADLRGADMRALHLREAQLTNARADATTMWPADFDVHDRRRHGIVEDTPAATT